MSILFNCGIQAKLREAASLEKNVLLKKIRDGLESLKGRVAGRNKDDVHEAISLVSSISNVCLIISHAVPCFCTNV